MITLYNVINKRVNGDNGWRDITEEEYNKYSQAFRDFLVATCRKNSNRRTQFEKMQFSTIAAIGIFDRLVYNNKGKVEYIAGQDYVGELEYIKRTLLK